MNVTREETWCLDRRNDDSRTLNRIGTVTETVRVIDPFEEFHGAGETEFADRLGLPKSTVHISEVDLGIAYR